MVQVVREYLSGLVEESPLKDVFAAWTGRLAGAVRPPDAETLVVPEPEKLATEALLAQLKAEEQDHFATTLPNTGPKARSTRQWTWPTRPVPVRGGSGPCAGCARFEPHDDHVHRACHRGAPRTCLRSPVAAEACQGRAAAVQARCGVMRASALRTTASTASSLSPRSRAMLAR